jgi:alpha-tubulin suppressor-like RCC1 family protein
MTSHAGGSKPWQAWAAVVLALIPAVLIVLLASDVRSASAQTLPQVDPWAWGRNSEGQLGNGTNDTNAHPNPVQVSNLTDVIDVADGGLHSLAIKSDGTDDGPANDGTVWSWGNNFQGQLGDGTSGSGTNKNTPVQASGLTDVVDVAGGNNHSLAIKSDGTGDGPANDGTVWSWGFNNRGQLGYDPDPATTGTFESSSTPGQVSGLTDVIAVAGGTSHSMALKSDGTVWAWGINDVGQLGNGESGSGNMSITPVQVEDLSDPTGFLTGVVTVAAGSHHNLAVKSDGTVWTWGFNSQGMLGNGTSGTDSNVPVQASNLTDATDVSGGNFHSVALKSDGTVWAWGANDKGQLGNGTIAGSNTPVQVKDPGDPNDPNDDVPLTDVKDVSSGLNHNLAATSTHGAVWAWGCNDYGQLGNSGIPRNPGSNCASPAFSRTPVQTIGLFDATEIAGGGSHSLALASIDNAAPDTTGTPSPAPNAAGWNNSDVTLNLNATDTGGSSVREIIYSATGAQTIPSTTDPGDSASIPITTEGETTITYHATDNAGNLEAPEETLTVKLDKSAPTVDSWSPTGRGVGRRTNITAAFSDEMDEATLTSQTVKLLNTATGKRVRNVVVGYDEATKTLTLDPFGNSTTLLAKSTKYKVTITTAVENLADTRMVQAKSWSFTTGRRA